MQNRRALCLAPPLKWSILPLSEHILISGRTEVHVCWQAQKTSENNDSSKGHQIETSCKCTFLDTPAPSLIYFCSTWSLRRYHYVWVHTTVIAKDSSNFANCLAATGDIAFIVRTGKHAQHTSFAFVRCVKAGSTAVDFRGIAPRGRSRYPAEIRPAGKSLTATVQ